ncbi:MAG: DHH family phosphoesterase [Firmicutes bacterium]|nr:DHH family phosphoesterase [Bacillota bacterium]
MKKRYGRITSLYIWLVEAAAALLILCGVANIISSHFLGIAQVVFGVLILAAAIIIEKIRAKKAEEYISDVVPKTSGDISVNAVTSLPMPLAVTHADGVIQWYNTRFSQMLDNDTDFHGTVFAKVFPSVKWGDVLRTRDGIIKDVKIGGRQYDVISRVVKNRPVKNSVKEDEYSIYIYFEDKTLENKAIADYENKKTDVAVICLDNYDEIFRKLDDMEEQRENGKINSIINDWASKSNAVLKKIDNDRYYIFFEHSYLQMYKDSGFDIIEKIRKTGDETKLPISASIGVGTGNDLKNNEIAARSALDLAQSRGGDQVGINDNNQYSFFGGRNVEYEKSSRVKTRAVAEAIKKYIAGSDAVFLLGHKNPDYDCFGAAMGLQSAVRALGKTPYIVIGDHTESIRKLYKEISEMPEYKGMFIDEDDALQKQTDASLVIVLDTHKPSMVQSLRLVERSKKVVLIDHHRRSTDIIDNSSLIYQEPYASSTCEMVTEIIEYMSTASSITAKEVECLYTGILLDTKNFLVKTGVRTFEAASYLRRMGLNTFDVKKLFNVDKDEYDRRAEIVRTATEAAPNFAVAYTKNDWPNIRVIASQAADDLLNINSVRASFVVYPDEGKACISARSLSDVNVHLIMESLGGGGHATVAAAQIKDTSVDDAVERLKKAIAEYLENNK